MEVDKLRHILGIDNVKFHVDEVQGVGAFVEIEAIGRTGATATCRWGTTFGARAAA